MRFFIIGAFCCILQGTIARNASDGWNNKAGDIKSRLPWDRLLDSLEATFQLQIENQTASGVIKFKTPSPSISSFEVSTSKHNDSSSIVITSQVVAPEPTTTRFSLHSASIPTLSTITRLISTSTPIASSIGTVRPTEQSLEAVTGAANASEIELNPLFSVLLCFLFGALC